MAGGQKLKLSKYRHVIHFWIRMDFNVDHYFYRNIGLKMNRKENKSIVCDNDWTQIEKNEVLVF